LTFNIVGILYSLILIIPTAFFLKKWIVEFLTLRNVKRAFKNAKWEDGYLILGRDVSYLRNYAVVFNIGRIKPKKKIIVLRNWEKEVGKRIEVKDWGFVNDGKRSVLRAPLLEFEHRVRVMLLTPLNSKFEEKEIKLEEEEGTVEARVSDFIQVEMYVKRVNARKGKFHLKGSTAYEDERLFGFISLLTDKTRELSKEIRIAETKDKTIVKKRLDVNKPIVIIFTAEDPPKILKLKKYINGFGGNDVEYFAKVILDIPFAKDKYKEVPLKIKK